MVIVVLVLHMLDYYVALGGNVKLLHECWPLRLSPVVVTENGEFKVSLDRRRHTANALDVFSPKLH